MKFLKQYPILSAILLVALLAFGVGCYLAYSSWSQTGSLKTQIERDTRRLQQLSSQSPAPESHNLLAATQNLKQLRTELQQSIDALEGSFDPRKSTDSLRVLSEVQRMIVNFRRQAANAGVQIPEGEGFGFGLYIEEVPELSSEVVPLVDLQRQVLLFTVNQLIQALGQNPEEESTDATIPGSIVAIERELVENPDRRYGTTNATGRGSSSDLPRDTFIIDPLVSARVPGALETLAFRFQFTGYTRDLREFLNSLAGAELPIVIRSVEAAPAATAQTAPTRRNQPRDTEAATREPIIDQNATTFTVTFEYIDVVLDPETAGNEALANNDAQ